MVCGAVRCGGQIVGAGTSVVIDELVPTKSGKKAVPLVVGSRPLSRRLFLIDATVQDSATSTDTAATVLIDSGSSADFVSPEHVRRCGLHAEQRTDQASRQWC